MDFTEPITYNGFTFLPPTPVAGQPLDGVQIKRARYTNVDTVAYWDKRALDDGMDAVDVFLGGRRVIIDAAVYGSTLGRLWDNLTDLTTAFDPVIAYNASTASRGFLPFRFYRPTADVATWPESTYPSGIPLRMDLRPDAPISYDLSQQTVGGLAAGGGAIPVTIALIARDPRIYLTSTQSAELSGPTPNATATHRGTHPTWPTLTLAVSGAASSAVTIAIDGFSVRVNLSSASAGDTFTINYQTRHAVNASGSQNNSIYVSSVDQAFQAIQPGGSAVAGFNLTNVTATLTWREAWL